MRKGSLKLLLSAVVMAVGASAFAASPVLKTLPTIVISDQEDNVTATVDLNLFVFTDAFAFADYATDADTPASGLKWTYQVGVTGTGDISINDIDSTTAGADDPADPASPINTVATATFREIALSPGTGTTGGPFPTPSEITTPDTPAPSDVNGDGIDDKLVGELAVTFFVADNQATLSAVASKDTFVWTYDNDFGSTAAVYDSLLDNGMDFTAVDLIIGTGTGSGGDPDWYYENWTSPLQGSQQYPDWLSDAVSGTQGSSPYSAFEITGSTAGSPAWFAAALGAWYAPTLDVAYLAPGKVYSARAGLGLNDTKTATDQPRIGIQENTVANVNQTYVVTGASSNVLNSSEAGPHPFLASAGSTREYLSTVDPLDADVVDNGTGDNLPYLFKFDYVNPTSAIRTAAMTSFEVGSADSTDYNSAAASIKVYGSGGGETNFSGVWAETPFSATQVPLDFGGGDTLLAAAASVTVNAGDIAVAVNDQSFAANGGNNISFGQTSNLALGGAVIDDLEVIAGAAYRADFSIAMNGGSQPAEFTFGGRNPLGLPTVRLGAQTPIPSFSIEYFVSPRNTNLFTADDVPATLEMYWTAATQFAGGTSVGEENDQGLVFGVQDLEFTDGTATMQGLEVFEVTNDDPNVDY
jgi:hypothetical protein